MLNKSFKDVPDYHEEFKVVLSTIKNYGLKDIFLDGGTLLGAIREGTYLRHDMDIDLGCYWPDMNLLVYSKSFPAFTFAMRNMSYSVEKKDDQTLKLIKFSNDGKYRYKIDLFGFARTDAYYWHKCFGGIMTYPVECLDTLDNFKFKDVDVLIPHNVDKFLANVYGDSWRTPNPNFKKPFEYKNYHRLDEMQHLFKE